MCSMRECAAICWHSRWRLPPAAQPDARTATNSYRVWIDEYAGVPYQEVAAKARAHLDLLTHLYATPAREAELIAIFKETARLEANFWEMGWRAGQRVE